MREIRSPLDGIISPFASRRFTPSLLFRANEPGYVYDLNDVTTLFKDVNGTQPVTAVADPVALRLDVSRARALGSELVTNGDFSSGTGWTLQTGWTISGGLLVGNVAAAAFTNATNAVIPVAGRTYQITYTVTAVTSGAVRLLFYGGTVVSGTVRSTVGTFTELLVANSGHTGLGFQGQGAGFVGTIDNITVRELAGTHAAQPDAAKRPLYALLPANGLRNLANGSAAVSTNVWQSGVTHNGVTVTKIGSGTDTDGLPYVDVRYQGTSTNTVHDQICEFGAFVQSGVSGQQATCSFIARVIGGSTTNVIGFCARVSEETAPSTFIGIALGSYVTAGVDTLTTATRPLSTGNQWRATLALNFNTASVIDVTYRIKALQFELGSTRTAYQFNYAATNISQPPFSQVGALLYDGVDDFMVTPAINFESYTWDGQARRNLALGSAQPANDAAWPASTSRNGVTATKVGSGFEADGLPFVDLRYQGTASGTFHELAFSYVPTAASSGQSWTCSAIMRVVGGSISNVSGLTVRVQELDAVDGFIDNSPADRVTAAVDTVSTSTNVIGTGVKTRALVELAFTSGVAIDVTYRVKALQFELGATRTAWQGTGTDKVFLCHGVRKTSDADGSIAELTASADVTNGAFGVYANAPGGPGIYQVRSRGTTVVSRNFTKGAPDTAVLTLISDISAPNIIMRWNGTQVSQSNATQGTGNYSNAQVFFGSRGGTSMFFKGYEFSSLCRGGAIPPAAQIVGAEGWVRARTAGAY